MQNLNERINSHKSSFINPSKHGRCQILCNFFTSGMCKEPKYHIQMIEKLLGNGKKTRVP